MNHSPKGNGIQGGPLSTFGILTGKGMSTSGSLFHSHHATCGHGLVVTLECSQLRVLLPQSYKVAGQLRIMITTQVTLIKDSCVLRPWATSFIHCISFHLHTRLVIPMGQLRVPEAKQQAQDRSKEE